MTTLNAKANAAYHAEVEAYERDFPGCVFGFSHQRDAYEAGYEKAAQVALADHAELNEAFGFAHAALLTLEAAGSPIAQHTLDQLRSLYPKATEGKS